MAREYIYNPCGVREGPLGLNPWSRDFTPTTTGGGNPPGFHPDPGSGEPALPDPLRTPTAGVPVASVKLKAICPNPAGNTAAERAMQWQNMTPEEREAKKKEQVTLGAEIDEDLWQFLYITRNLIKATQEIALKLVDEEWMTAPEAEKWVELHVAIIMKDANGAETLYGGGSVLCTGPERRSRLVFDVNQAKNTQFYRKVRVYADLFFLDALSSDVPPEDPGEFGDVDPEWQAFSSEFGALLAQDYSLPPPDDGSIEVQDDDAERGKWVRVEIEPPEEEEDAEAGDGPDAGGSAANEAAERAQAFEREKKAASDAAAAKAQEFALKGQFKIREKKQGLHVPGSKTFQKDRGRSELKHPNPQDLLDRYAGTGGRKFYTSDGRLQKEVVECGGVIGNFRRPGSKLAEPTTRAIIHYDRKGQAHIVPARPGGSKTTGGDEKA